MNKWRGFDCTLFCCKAHRKRETITLRANIGMCSMQELIFGWVGWGRPLCEPYVFIFVTEKKHNFQKNENIVLLHVRERKKSLNNLNLHKFFVVYCLYCLHTSEQKNKKCNGATLNVFSFAAVVWSRHPTPSQFLIRGIARVAGRDQIKVAEESAYCRSSTREKIKIIHLKNMIRRNLTKKSKLKLCCISNRP